MYHSKKTETHIAVQTDEGFIQRVKVLVTERVPGFPDIEVCLGDCLFTDLEIVYLLNEIRTALSGDGFQESPIRIL